MLGPQQNRGSKLFYTGFDLDARIADDHVLRRIDQTLDFSFVRPAVAHLYGSVGSPSMDPIVLLKLMMLLFLEDVSSERALMRQLPCRLDWLWFCGFDIDSPLPDHSVLSKARRRWGRALFTQLFQRIVRQCVEAGLVDGGVTHMDSSLIDADASLDSLHPLLKLHGDELYDQLESACDPAPTPANEADDDHSPTPPTDDPNAPIPLPVEAVATAPDTPAPGTRVSDTDPDAQLTRKYKQTTLGYKDHRVVDDRFGIITSTQTTGAAEADHVMLMDGLDQHRRHTGRTARIIVADKAYGTGANYQTLLCEGVQPCIPHKRPTEAKGDKFRRDAFVYDANRDMYHCPGGQTLHPRGRPSDGRTRYQTRDRACKACPLKEQCTDHQRGRLLSRHVLQDAIDTADQRGSPGQRRRLMARRKHKAEGSFADAANQHGFKRARWRGLNKVKIQNLLIATVQNLRKLLKYGNQTTPQPKPLHAIDLTHTPSLLLLNLGRQMAN